MAAKRWTRRRAAGREGRPGGGGGEGKGSGRRRRSAERVHVGQCPRVRRRREPLWRQMRARWSGDGAHGWGGGVS